MKLLLDRILPAKHEVAVSTDHEIAAESLIEALSQAKDEMERREAAWANVEK